MSVEQYKEQIKQMLEKADKHKLKVIFCYIKAILGLR